MRRLSVGSVSAAAAVALALVYLVGGLAMGHTASSTPPLDLSAQAESVDVYQALTLLADQPGQVAILDVRSSQSYELYHLPGARNLPGADAAALQQAAGGKQQQLIVAGQQEQAAQLAGELRAKKLQAHYLAGGAQAWYLALELPVPLFAEGPPPHGYLEALEQIRSWLHGPRAASAPGLKQAIERLAAASYSPTRLKSSGRPKSSGKKKKISGGCS